MKGLVGGPLLVGGLGPGPPGPSPLNSGPEWMEGKLQEAEANKGDQETLSSRTCQASL